MFGLILYCVEFACKLLLLLRTYVVFSLCLPTHVRCQPAFLPCVLPSIVPSFLISFLLAVPRFCLCLHVSSSTGTKTHKSPKTGILRFSHNSRTKLCFLSSTNILLLRLLDAKTLYLSESLFSLFSSCCQAAAPN